MPASKLHSSQMAFHVITQDNQNRELIIL